ncbi:APC family permease [Peptacetobacter sp.]|uniref:APC family permease n=1 Tax=Peptacetobacter sp. TaxID=2991975 RepID=UPI0026065FCF|nr:amino acid permease [Peptacetobacter sp.]
MAKKIKLFDLILMSISTLYGIRWIAKSTASSFGLGLAAIPSWLVFAILFFIPQALICAELANRFSDKSDGGLYVWVKEALGEKYGFMAAWLNWTSKIFWYASFMTFFVINISYFIGKPEMANNKIIVMVLSVVIFWLLSMMSMKGMGGSKIFTSFGAFGSFIPSVILITFAFIAIVILKKQPSASVYSLATMTPKLTPDSLVAVSGIIFGFTGAEVIANFITEIDNPKKTYPKAILISAILVAGLYILGSIAITMILPPEEIQASTGILDSIGKVSAMLGIGNWIVRIIAGGVAFSMLGATIIYIASPIKMLFGSVPKGMFPEKFTKVNSVGIPEKAVILQTVIVSLLLIATAVMPGVDIIYNILVTMTALTALLPYVLLLISYIKIRKASKNDNYNGYEMSKSNKVCIGIGYETLVLCVMGILFSCAPVMGTFRDNIIYEIEMIGGGLIVIISGLIIWNRYIKKINK